MLSYGVYDCKIKAVNVFNEQQPYRTIKKTKMVIDMRGSQERDWNVTSHMEDNKVFE